MCVNGVNDKSQFRGWWQNIMVSSLHNLKVMKYVIVRLQLRSQHYACAIAHTLDKYTADFKKQPKKTTCCRLLSTTTSFTNTSTPSNAYFVSPSPAHTGSVLVTHLLVESLSRSQQPTRTATHLTSGGTTNSKLAYGIPRCRSQSQCCGRCDLGGVATYHSFSERTAADA